MMPYLVDTNIFLDLKQTIFNHIVIAVKTSKSKQKLWRPISEELGRILARKQEYYG